MRELFEAFRVPYATSRPRAARPGPAGSLPRQYASTWARVRRMALP